MPARPGRPRRRSPGSRPGPGWSPPSWESRGRCPRPGCEPSVRRLVPSPPRPYDQPRQAPVSVLVDLTIPAPVAPFTLFGLRPRRPLFFGTFASRRIAAAHSAGRRATLKTRVEAAATAARIAAGTAGRAPAATEATARRTAARTRRARRAEPPRTSGRTTWTRATRAAGRPWRPRGTEAAGAGGTRRTAGAGRRTRASGPRPARLGLRF